MTVAFGLFLFIRSALADWTPVKRLTWSVGNSYDPDLAIDSAGFVHLVWRDDIASNTEVYCKKGKE